jgi:hypothetical protein
MKAISLAVVALQSLLLAIPAIGAVPFDRAGVELDRDVRWRYGYVVTRHGAVLVRAPLAGAAGPAPSVPADAVSTFMARELKARPWKCGLELIFYAGLMTIVHVSRRRAPSASSAVNGRVRRLARAAGLAVTLVTVTMAPYLFSGYGEPLFSTWRGPGALSSSGLVPATAPVVPAVSYGLLLQWLFIMPMIASSRAAETLSLALGIRGSLWLVTAAFWGLIAAIGAFAGTSHEAASRHVVG